MAQDDTQDNTQDDNAVGVANDGQAGDGAPAAQPEATRAGERVEPSVELIRAGRETLAYYAGDDLGAQCDAAGDSTTFTLWAPTAESVTVRLYKFGSSEEGRKSYEDYLDYCERLVESGEDNGIAEATLKSCDGVPDSQNRELQEYVSFYATHTLDRDPDFESSGIWRARIDKNLAGVYYDYLIEFPDGSHAVTADPWAKAAGVNGLRSMVVDLPSTNPEGWEADIAPDIPPQKLVVWETHITDFSLDPRSGIPADHRGTYLAFTHPDTSLDGEGVTPTCVAYLKYLGVTAVQIEPMYDFGSVDESLPRADRTYNWGYDPVNYNVPEGGYSTDPFDGATRIREVKQMVAALHQAGIKVIMDVVYNHMYTQDNWFERTVPGYFCRRYDDTLEFTNGSGCGCDMASEKPMFRDYIADSVAYWAREYHIDGFRFDLMGLIDVDTMTQVRARLEALGDGKDYILYGEPWACADTPANHKSDLPLSTNANLDHVEEHIGAFSDATRDTIKGHFKDVLKAGYVNGAADEAAPDIIDVSDAWRHCSRLPHHRARQMVQYVSSHDDLTLWDKLCLSMRRGKVTTADFEALSTVDDIVAANRLAAAVVLTSAGVPFFLSGEEFARTKHGNGNSYAGPFSDNVIFWERAERMSWLVDTYRLLIAARGSDPAFAEGVRTQLPCEDKRVIAFQTGEHVVAFNPTDDACVVPAGVGARGSYVVRAHDFLIADVSD